MKLVPLQVPLGWEVKWNHFYDVTIEEKLDDGLLGYPFYEDILYMLNEPWMIAIDLGWCPDGAPDGAYSLQLLMMKVAQTIHPPIKKAINRKIGDINVRYKLVEEVEVNWGKPIDTFNSRNIIEVQNKLNEFLHYTGT